MYLFVIILTIVVSTSCGFTPPPMSTPPRAQPPLKWDNRDIKYYFKDCIVPVSSNMSAVYFCDPSNQINRENATTIAQTLNVMRSPERCIDHTSRGLSVGVAIINQMNIISNKTTIVMKNYNQMVRDIWGTLHSECNAAILLFVSCEDFYMYETLGTNTSNIVDYRCQYVFDVTEPIYNKSEDCFSGLIESRIETYKQVVDGTHPCYTDHIHHHSYTAWIALGVVDLFAAIIVTIIVYHICTTKPVVHTIGPTAV
jgi:Modulator of levamisole receptor-1